MALQFATAQFSAKRLPPEVTLTGTGSEFILMIDARGHIEAVSGSALLMLRCEEEEVLGAHYSRYFRIVSLCSPGESAAAAQDGDDWLGAPADVAIFGFAHCSDGSRVPLEIIVRTCRDPRDGDGAPSLLFISSP